AYIDRLDRWTSTAERYAGADRVYAPELLRGLVGKSDNPVQIFEQTVVRTYETLALRARVAVMEKIATAFANPERSLPHVESVLREELNALADRQTQLVTLLDDLNVLQIDASKAPVAFAGKSTLNARTTFARLARVLHTAPDGLPLLTESEQTVLELAPSKGGYSVVAPTAA